MGLMAPVICGRLSVQEMTSQHYCPGPGDTLHTERNVGKQVMCRVIMCDLLPIVLGTGMKSVKFNAHCARRIAQPSREGADLRSPARPAQNSIGPK